MLEVKTGAERRSRTLQHHQTRFAVTLQALEVSVKSIDQSGIERIEAFRTIEGHPVNPIIMFDQKRFSHALLRPFLYLSLKGRGRFSSKSREVMLAPQPPKLSPFRECERTSGAPCGSRR